MMPIILPVHLRNNLTNDSDAHLNDTFLSWYNVTQEIIVKGKVYWALFMIPLPLVAVVGNILVILSVYKEKSLQTATNYFIVSLAFADLLVASVVMPFAVYVLVNVDWELSETLCDFYIALDVTCSTASIFNLVAISIDRFIAVTQPIKYAKHKNHKRVFLTIAIVWLVSAAIGLPIVLGLNTSHERIPNLCVFYNSDFIIYSSLSSFYIPCLVMIYLYYKIFDAIHQRAKKAIGNQKTKTSATDKSSAFAVDKDLDQSCFQSDIAIAQHKKHKQILSPLEEVPENRIRSSLECNEINEKEGYLSEAGGPDCKISTNDKSKYVGQTCERYTDTSKKIEHEEIMDEDEKLLNIEKTCSTSTTVLKLNGNSGYQAQKATKTVDEESNLTDPNESSPKSTDNKKKTIFSFARRKKSSRRREKNAARRERKATKTLAIVLAVFLICWVPFFTCNILDAICIKLDNDTFRPGMTSFLLTTWLGYINSCVNPVIYTIFNMEFRKAFKKLLFIPYQ